MDSSFKNRSFCSQDRLRLKKRGLNKEEPMHGPHKICPFTFLLTIRLIEKKTPVQPKS